MPLHRSSGRWRLGLSLALTTVSLWGVLPIALKVVLQTADVYTVTWFRFSISFVVLGLYLAARQQLPSWQKLCSARLELLAIATLFLSVNYLFYLQGLHQTSPTNSQVIIQLAPVFFGLGALAIFKERYTLKQWAGLAVLTTGMLLFFNDQLREFLGASAAYLTGTGILILAAIAWAIYALAQKQLLQHLTSPVIMLVIYGGSALLFAPAANPAQLMAFTPLQWGMLLFSGFNTVIAYGAFAEALDHWEASRVSAVLSLTPLVTLLSVFSASIAMPGLVEPEQTTLPGLVGALLVVGGSLAISVGKTPDSLVRGASSWEGRSR